MKKYFLYTAMALMLLLVVGCKDVNDGENGANVFVQEATAEQIEPDDFARSVIDTNIPEFKGEVREKYAGIINPLLEGLEMVFNRTKAKEISKLDRLFEAEAGLSKQTGHCWQVETYTFNYSSKSARGEDVILSGRVIFPNHKTKGIGHQVKSMMIYMHGALLKGRASSDVIGVESLRTFFDEAIIEPDGQGCGVNKEDDYYCMVSSDVLARQTADCTLAALEIMQRHGVTLADNGHTICVGKSLGGAVAPAFAKYYETEASPSFREKVRLTAVYEAIGPLDYEATIRYFSDHPDYNAMLSKSILFSLAALSPQQLYGYRAQDFVNQNLLNMQVEYNGRTMSYYEAEAKYFVNVLGLNKEMPNPKKLSEIIASDMLGQDGKLDGTNLKTQMLMRILAEQNSLSGWLPTIPIYIMHCTQDDAIPVEQTRKCYNELSNSGGNPKVHLKEITLPAALVPVGKLTGLCVGHIYPGLFFTKILVGNEDPSKELLN